MFPLNSVSIYKKIFIIKKAQTCQLLCKRPGSYQSASKTHEGDRIFKMISWLRFPKFAEITEFNESSALFSKTLLKHCFYVNTYVPFTNNPN